MTGLRLDADLAGNIHAAGTVSSPADVARVDPVAGGLVALEMACDEPVHFRIEGPGLVVRAVLYDALAQLEELL